MTITPWTRRARRARPMGVGRPPARVSLALVFVLLVGLVAVPLAEPAGATAPAIPTGLTANESSGSTTFNWTATPGATCDELMCELQGYEDSILQVGAVTTANFSLPTGYNSCFIRAGNNVPEWSAWGSFITASVFPHAPAPAGLSRTAYDRAVTLKWSPSTQYLAHRGWRITSTPATAPVHYWQVAVPIGGSPEVEVTGLTVGVSYTFHLETWRPYGPSDQFNQYGDTRRLRADHHPARPGRAHHHRCRLGRSHGDGHRGHRRVVVRAAVQRKSRSRQVPGDVQGSGEPRDRHRVRRQHVARGVPPRARTLGVDHLRRGAQQQRVGTCGHGAGTSSADGASTAAAAEPDDPHRRHPRR